MRTLNILLTLFIITTVTPNVVAESYFSQLLKHAFTKSTWTDNDWETFDSGIHGLKVSYPSSWNKCEIIETDPIFCIQRKTGRFAMISIDKKRFRGDRQKIMNAIQSDPEAFIQGAETRLPSLELVDKGHANLGGYNGYSATVTYSAYINGTEIKMATEQIYYISNGFFYLAQFETMIDDLKPLHTEFLQIINTVRL